MMRQWLAVALLLAMSASVFAITCPAGEHAQCHSGSGRGGGYRSICSCVADGCSFGYFFYPVGATVVSYTQYQVTPPDDCSNYAVQSICMGNNDWSPLPAGLFCNPVVPFFDE